MPLSAGTRIGSYEIVGLLGAGGMGEVYRARDSNLHREVAIKVLPDLVADDPDRLARFEREARTLAALNHPHIAAIYGFEESNGACALVMELVEGPTLADRIEQGPIPIDEALPIARQIAEALEAAHEQGIIHRDLKPANIKLRPDGTVKVLDFGLAKALELTGVPSVLSEAPTGLSPALTLAGIILGTPTYMSPEQARGKTVDTRTDIWAFGCVLYEMLTGKRPFPGETVTDTVAALISNEPDWQALPHGTPQRIQSLIVRCLRKDPAQRLRDIADGRFQIEEVASDPGALTPVVTQARTYSQWAAWIAAALFLGTTLFFAARLSTTSSSRDSISFPVSPPEKAEFFARTNTTLDVPSFALSPDGHAMVFSAGTPGARPMLWLRSLDHVDARQLPGTEGAQDPFWSPDSRWIGFFADGTLRKVPVVGGAVQLITQAGNDFRGATWADGREIYYLSGDRKLMAVPIGAGPQFGIPKPLFQTQVLPGVTSTRTHYVPSHDGQRFLVNVATDTVPSPITVVLNWQSALTARER